MSRSRYELTAQVQRDITMFLRAGGTPQTCVEAAGIPWRVFQRWMDLGKKGREPYGDFVKAVRQAEAQARLKAELAVFDARPLDWLKSGPGRENADRRGWTKPVGPMPAASVGGLDAESMRVEVFRLFGWCADELEGHPDSRMHLARLIAGLRVPPPSENPLGEGTAGSTGNPSSH